MHYEIGQIFQKCTYEHIKTLGLFVAGSGSESILLTSMMNVMNTMLDGISTKNNAFDVKQFLSSQSSQQYIFMFLKSLYNHLDDIYHNQQKNISDKITIQIKPNVKVDEFKRKIMLIWVQCLHMVPDINNIAEQVYAEFGIVTEYNYTPIDDNNINNSNLIVQTLNTDISQNINEFNNSMTVYINNFTLNTTNINNFIDINAQYHSSYHNVLINIINNYYDGNYNMEWVGTNETNNIVFYNESQTIQIYNASLTRINVISQNIHKRVSDLLGMFLIMSVELENHISMVNTQKTKSTPLKELQTNNQMYIKLMKLSCDSFNVLWDIIMIKAHLLKDIVNKNKNYITFNALDKLLKYVITMIINIICKIFRFNTTCFKFSWRNKIYILLGFVFLWRYNPFVWSIFISIYENLKEFISLSMTNDYTIMTAGHKVIANLIIKNVINPSIVKLTALSQFDLSIQSVCLVWKFIERIIIKNPYQNVSDMIMMVTSDIKYIPVMYDIAIDKISQTLDQIKNLCTLITATGGIVKVFEQILSNSDKLAKTGKELSYLKDAVQQTAQNLDYITDVVHDTSRNVNYLTDIVNDTSRNVSLIKNMSDKSGMMSMIQTGYNIYSDSYHNSYEGMLNIVQNNYDIITSPKVKTIAGICLSKVGSSISSALNMFGIGRTHSRFLINGGINKINRRVYKKIHNTKKRHNKLYKNPINTRKGKKCRNTRKGKKCRNTKKGKKCRNTKKGKKCRNTKKGKK
jgi:hypothetical protein